MAIFRQRRFARGGQVLMRAVLMRAVLALGCGSGSACRFACCSFGHGFGHSFGHVSGLGGSQIFGQISRQVARQPFRQSFRQIFWQILRQTRGQFNIKRVSMGRACGLFIVPRHVRLPSVPIHMRPMCGRLFRFGGYGRNAFGLLTHQLADSLALALIILSWPQSEAGQNTVDQFRIEFAAAINAAADAFGQQTAPPHGGIAVDDPLLQFGHAFARCHKHVADGFFVVGVHAQGDGGTVFKKIQRFKDQRLQYFFVLFFQHPADAGGNGLLREQGQLIAPGFANGVTLPVQSMKHRAKGLPYFSAKFLEFLPGLIHSGLKTIGLPVFTQDLRFLTQGLCLRQFRLRLVSFFLGLRLYGCAFVREPLVQFMRFNPGFFQHFLALGIGRAKYFARTLLGLGPHPIKIVFLLLVLHAFAAQGLLHGVKLLHGGFALTHEDSSPFFAQLI